MRQFHARFHFWRISLVDARKAEIIEAYAARWSGPIRPAMEAPRYQRLCRIAALYRTAGYLNRQEI